MADKWYAECIPCGFEEQHDDQGAAIRAAEDHVYAHHRDVLPHVRGELKIGHVQNRTVGAIGTATDTSPATPLPKIEFIPSVHDLGKAPAATSPASEAPPNPEPSGEER